MTMIEMTDFVRKTPVDELKRLREGLDLLRRGLPLDPDEAQIELLLSLYDQESWFRRYSDIKITKSNLIAEEQDRLERNVPPNRWG